LETLLAGSRIPNAEQTRILLFLRIKGRSQEAAIRRKDNIGDGDPVALEFADPLARRCVVEVDSILGVTDGNRFTIGSEGNVPRGGKTQDFAPDGGIVYPRVLVV
jgi:hypothetical protein